MPSFDQRYDTAPRNKQGRPRGPKISDLKAALTDHDATTYTDERLTQMTYNDLVYAANTHNLTVTGL